MYLIFKAWRKRKREEREQRDFEARVAKMNRDLEEIERIISDHSRSLANKYDQLFYEDDYGNIIADKWIKEVDYFIDSTLLRVNVVRNFINEASDPHEAQNRIDLIADLVFEVASQESISRAKLYTSNNVSIESLSGIEYEFFCTDRLIEIGWEARRTSATGDQGVDIIASIEGVPAVFQCKRYSGSVGNSAVQEVIAGRSYYRSRVAAVITNSSFTTSAKQLAKSTGVYLLHHDDLEDFTQDILNRLV